MGTHLFMLTARARLLCVLHLLRHEYLAYIMDVFRLCWGKWLGSGDTWGISHLNELLSQDRVQSPLCQGRNIFGLKSRSPTPQC